MAEQRLQQPKVQSQLKTAETLSEEVCRSGVKKHADVSVNVVVSAHELQMPYKLGSPVAACSILQCPVKGLYQRLPTTWCQKQRRGAGSSQSQHEQYMHKGSCRLETAPLTWQLCSADEACD